MPIKVQNDLPAKKILEEENIFVMDETRAMSQDIRPLKIAILNLMPLKEATEVQLMRSLSNTPLQVDITFLTTASYIGKNTPTSHLEQFYLTYEDVKNQKFDGMIITGAPVEQLDYSEVLYWEELCKIMEWSKTNVTSTFHICWGAQAGLYYHYGIKKIDLPKKISGIFKHRVHTRKEPIIRGFDDIFCAPHSRYTGIDEEAVRKCPDLKILADSEEAGPSILLAKEGKQIFVLCHPEYDRMTLDTEYHRDLDKGIKPDIPTINYINDDPAVTPLLMWRAHANTLYSNWLNYYVYQVTPFNLM